MTRLNDVLLKARAIVRSTKSPAATGQMQHHEIGKTRSGKTIMSHPDHVAHSSFTTHDHADAYRAHAQKLSTANPYHAHPALLEHHKASIDHHFRAMQGQKVSKARFAEASFSQQFSLFKGRRTLGKTRSGKHIHASKHGADHPDYKGWSAHDHHDAMHAHHAEVQRITESLMRTAKRGGKGAKILQYLLGRHANAAHGHHAKAHKG